MSSPETIHAPESQLEAAVSILCKGGLVAFPTDTLYALGSHAFIETAVQRVYRAKGRPAGMALPLLLATAADVERVAINVPPIAWKLADLFWPGAITLVLHKAASISPTISGGGDTIAVRVPGHPLALELIERTGAPLTGTSANRSGGAEPVTAGEVHRQLGPDVDMIVNGGPCPLRGASTIVDMTSEPPRMVREGAISRAMLIEVCPSIQ
ncbi:MAG: threonylcarbamoyl-AMP synthase [Chloroflexi bacterium]|nr:threonylcarbamoyl-AMP synthase [Chloroflexota bacterium]